MDAPRGRRDARLLLAVAVVLAVAIVVVLFIAGVRVGQGGSDNAAPSPGAGASETATPVVTASPDAGEADAAAGADAPAGTDAAAGAQTRTQGSPRALPTAPTALAAPGEHPWSELFGGECLGAYTSPWEETFTVVDCAAPHPAQLVTRGLLPDDAAAPYPGEAELAGRLNLLCTAPTAVNTAAATDPADLRWQGAFPASAETWAAGDRVFYCFFTTASGAPLTASLTP